MSRGLSDKEKLELIALQSLAASRGITVDVPETIQTAGNIKWSVTEDGYFISNSGKTYNPTDAQKGFIESEARFSLYYGSRGSGKSAAGAQKGLRKVKQGESGVVLNPDFENFKYATWVELKTWIPWRAVVPSYRRMASAEWQPTQPFKIVFLNGAVVFCKGLKDPDSARGPNLNWLWYDEAGRDRDGVAWQLANASVRIGHHAQAWATATPKGLNHWMYKFFIEQDIPPEVLEEYSKTSDRPLVEWFYGHVQDNKENLDPTFYASLLTTYKTGFLKSQEVDGQFVNEEGQFGFSSWFVGKVLKAVPEDMELRDTVRYWDMAATEKKLKNDPDEAVGSKVSKTLGDPFDIVIQDQVAGYFTWQNLKNLILDTAKRDGHLVKVIIEQEPGSGGKNQVAEIQNFFKENDMGSWTVEGRRPTDRTIEANSWFSLAADGRVYLVDGVWVKKFLEQVDGFLIARHDDRVTSVSGAFASLNPYRQWRTVDFISL